MIALVFFYGTTLSFYDLSMWFDPTSYRANRAQYADVSFQTVDPKNIFDVALPSVQEHEDEGKRWHALSNTAHVSTTGLEELTAVQKSAASVDVFSTPPQLDGELITLTLLPRSRWQTLLNLDVIQVPITAQMWSSFPNNLSKQRNKPKEPPKAPEKAPFFLPTLPGIEPRFSLEEKDSQKENKKPTKRLDKGRKETQSPFIHKLVAEASDGDCE